MIKDTTGMEKKDLSELLYSFLDAIYLFQRKEEGLFGTSWQEIYLLKHVKDAGELSVGQVAECLKVPLFDASRLVSGLHDLGLVEKNRMPGNRRVVAVKITAEGDNLLARVEDFQFEIISRNAGVLTKDEFVIIESGVRKLRQLLEID